MRVWPLLRIASKVALSSDADASRLKQRSSGVITAETGMSRNVSAPRRILASSTVRPDCWTWTSSTLMLTSVSSSLREKTPVISRPSSRSSSFEIGHAIGKQSTTKTHTIGTERAPICSP